MPFKLTTPVLETLTIEEIESSRPEDHERVSRIGAHNADIVREYSALQRAADLLIQKFETPELSRNSLDNRTPTTDEKASHHCSTDLSFLCRSPRHPPQVQRKRRCRRLPVPAFPVLSLLLIK
jgi:hypothetical protein